MTATHTPAANCFQPIDPQPDDALPMPNRTDKILAQIRTELLTTFSAADWEPYNHLVGSLRDTDVASHALKVGDAAPDLLLPDAEPFRPADRLVTNAEWMEFIEDGGYTKPVLALPAHPRGRRVQGKFMSGRFVLRAGSCVTPPGHLRASYRNFSRRNALAIRGAPLGGGRVAPAQSKPQGETR